MDRFPIDIPGGLVTGESTFAARGRYIDGSMFRFVQTEGDKPARAQIIGGWESLTLNLLSGICRNSLAWTDLDGRLNVAFGTHTGLYVWRGGALTDITPLLNMPSVTLANPFSVTDTSAVVTVAHASHGLATADEIIVSSSAAIGGITPAGTYSVTVVDDSSYTFVHGSAATSTVADGGGTAVVIAPQVAFLPGKVDGTAGKGYGTSTYGSGFYGLPSTQDVFPRTWSFDVLGEALIASPRGGTIYMWENDLGGVAAPLANAPRQVTAALVTDERAVVAIGCNEETSGVFNPLCLRHSDLANETIWYTDTDTTAREKVIAGGGRLVAGRKAGLGLFLWTNEALLAGTYVGALDETYRFDTLGHGCGLIGANAHAVKGQTAYWLSPDLQLRTCGFGGEPEIITLPFRGDLESHLAVSQQDKVVFSTIGAFEELWIFYPDSRDGMENSRALSLNLKHGAPARHVLARTSFVDAGLASYPIGVTPDGQIYWHERGASADGGAMTGFLEAGPQYLDQSGSMVLLTSFWPDFQIQAAPVTLTLIGREYPQDESYEDDPQVVTPGASKIDVHFQARLVGYRLNFSSAPAELRLGTCIAEGRTTGQR